MSSELCLRAEESTPEIYLLIYILSLYQNLIEHLLMKKVTMHEARKINKAVQPNYFVGEHNATNILCGSQNNCLFCQYISLSNLHLLSMEKTYSTKPYCLNRGQGVLLR